MAFESPNYNEMPSGFSAYTENGKTYIRYNGRNIITETTGKCRSFNGTDTTAYAKAVRFAWSYDGGNERGKYRTAYDGEKGYK